MKYFLIYREPFSLKWNSVYFETTIIEITIYINWHHFIENIKVQYKPFLKWLLDELKESIGVRKSNGIQIIAQPVCQWSCSK